MVVVALKEKMPLSKLKHLPKFVDDTIIHGIFTDLTNLVSWTKLHRMKLKQQKEEKVKLM